MAIASIGLGHLHSKHSHSEATVSMAIVSMELGAVSMEVGHLPRQLARLVPPAAQADELANQLRAVHLELGGELLHEALRHDAHHVQRARRLLQAR